MQDKFISTTGIQIAMDGIDYSYTEENPRFKDSFWTNYILPIDLYYTPEVLTGLGNYASLYASEWQRYHEGTHIFEGKLRKAKMEVLEFGKHSIKVQIDSGFENLPNFDKKLADLPLLVKAVPDIYTHANQIVTQSYPDTVYNFPKIYTSEYNLESTEWKYFDSFYNNRALYESPDGNKHFLRNRIEGANYEVYNKNIIQPLPYIKYVLQKGFEDAGYILSGDILQDASLEQILLWNGGKIEQTNRKEKLETQEIKILKSDIDPVTRKWTKKLYIHAPGKYYFKLTNNNTNADYVQVSSPQLPANKIMFTSPGAGLLFGIHYLIYVDTAPAEQGVELVVYYNRELSQSYIDSLGVDDVIETITISPYGYGVVQGEPIHFVYNENEVNLKKSVPDMTFGELVTIIKNLKNYDLTIEGNLVYMNKINPSSEIKDFSKHETDNPTRSFTDKTAFLLKFADRESNPLKNIYFTENSYQLNKEFVPENTTEININLFCLPLESFRNSYTARAYNESALMLVHYDGLNADGDNHATEPIGVLDESVAVELQPWYLQRLTNYTYRWTFIADKNHIRNYDIRDSIYCYGRKHQIKSWTKRSISATHYAVEIETETY